MAPPASSASPSLMARATRRCCSRERAGRPGWRSDSRRLSATSSAICAMNFASTALRVAAVTALWNLASAVGRRDWERRRRAKAERVAAGGRFAEGKVLDGGRIVEALEGIVRPGDLVALEGNNQKQADFLSRLLASVGVEKVHDLYMLISSVSRPEHPLFARSRGTARGDPGSCFPG